MLSSSTVTTNLVLAGFAVATAVSSNTTHTEKDSAQLEGITQQMVASAATSAMGVDPWRGTAINTLAKQLSGCKITGNELQHDEFPLSDAMTPSILDAELFCTEIAMVNEGMRLDFSVDVPLTSGAEIELLACTNLTSKAWNILPRTQFSAGVTNHTVTIDWDYLNHKEGYCAFDWLLDIDDDGLPNLSEVLLYETDPYLGDSDGDGLSDGDEILLGTNPKSWDSDGDGLSDRREVVEFNSNPLAQDSDGDNVSDGIEASLGMNLNALDSDMDGLSDGYEMDNNLDPTSSDSDGDGTPDFDEVRDGGDPNCDERLPEPDGLIHYTVVGSASVSWTPESSDATNCNEIVMSNDVSGIGFSTWSDKGAFSVGGCAFIPNETGIYHFELVADDVGSAFVGGLELKGSWIRGLGYVSTPTSGVFIAGQEYSIGASLTNDGGPAVLGFGKFGEFEPIRRASLDADLSASVIIYEDAYYNNPEQPMIPKASTKAVYRFRANGGSFGARLTFDVENEDCLSGPSLTSMNAELGINQTLSRTIVYEGAFPSGEKDDIRIIARLVENETGEISAITSKVTVVRVEPRAELTSTAGRHRHVFGPFERVSISVVPIGDDLSVAIDGAVDEGSLYRLSNSKGVYGLSVTNLGSSFNTGLEVIYPSRVKASAIRQANGSDWLERHGVSPSGAWIGAVVDIHLEPTFVSFVPLTFLEGSASASGRSGVFAHPSVVLPDHRGIPEYVVEADIGDGNAIVGGDLIGLDGFSVVEGFDPGGFMYRIPGYWSFADISFPKTAHRFSTASQKYFLSESAIMKISKYGYSFKKKIIPIRQSKGGSHE